HNHAQLGGRRDGGPRHFAGRRPHRVGAAEHHESHAARAPMVRRALFRKLLRDLWHTRSQGIAISLVIAAGVAMFVAYFSAFDSLRLAQQTYYDRFRFADVVVTLKRAPLGLVDGLAGIPVLP